LVDSLPFTSWSVRFGVNVVVAQDTHLTALAELRHGACVGLRDAVVLNVGKGLARASSSMANHTARCLEREGRDVRVLLDGRDRGHELIDVDAVSSGDGGHRSASCRTVTSGDDRF
jgi:hypothetical protein